MLLSSLHFPTLHTPGSYRSELTEKIVLSNLIIKHWSRVALPRVAPQHTREY